VFWKSVEDSQIVVTGDEAKDNQGVCEKEKDSFPANCQNSHLSQKNDAYSMSSPSHKTIPYLVPEVMLHVPRRNAKVSTTHKYKVGMAIGSAVFVQGKFTMN
jgi:hypothetical protein